MISSAVIAQLAPSRLENHRSSRYRAEEQAIALGSFTTEDREVVVALYAVLRELDGVLGVEGAIDDPAPLLDFVARHPVSELVRRVQRVGTQARGDAHLTEAVHDIRGGALSALFVHLARVGRARFETATARGLFIMVRDHMKMMRNVVLDLDPAARERDLSFRPHSLGDLAGAVREFTATVDEQPVVVEVECTDERVIAESCVECSAIDRVAYNLMNNAARYTDRPAISAWLVTSTSDLRVAIANSISAPRRAVVADVLDKDPASLFGSFTTSGSGHGLRIVSELVSRAYGVARTETLIREGYVGAKIIDETFVTWFHWPLAGA